jgi:hypothetical protein
VDLTEASVDRGADVGHLEFSDAGEITGADGEQFLEHYGNRCVPVAIRVGCATLAAQGP